VDQECKFERGERISEIVFSADQWIQLLDTVSFIVILSSVSASARNDRAV
jgi:hypothetical protein